jgi:hypothetical protein
MATNLVSSDESYVYGKLIVGIFVSWVPILRGLIGILGANGCPYRRVWMQLLSQLFCETVPLNQNIFLGPEQRNKNIKIISSILDVKPVSLI